LAALRFSQKGSFLKAMEAIDVAITTDPKHQDYRLYKGSLCLQLGNIEEAKSIRMSLKQPQDEVRLFDALLFEAEGNIDKAVDALRRLMRESPVWLGPSFNFARIVSTRKSCSKKTADEAVAAIERVAQMGKINFVPDCSLYLVAAAAYASAGDYDSAQAYAETAARIYDAGCGIEEAEFNRASLCALKNQRYINEQWTWANSNSLSS
jgi:tetratricopeptide (TPR) repeat protein